MTVEVKTTACYMCACRCGIRVHLRDGELRYIDGNPQHPQHPQCASTP
jgi:anaerobic selenocysteine-containing dehydrogenase